MPLNNGQSPPQTKSPNAPQLNSSLQNSPSYDNVVRVGDTSAITQHKVDVSEPASSKKLSGLCLLEGIARHYEFDCGARMTCINKQIVDEMKWQHKIRPFEARAFGANGTQINTWGVIRVQIDIVDTSFELDVLVADLGKNRDILVGRDVYQYCPTFEDPMSAIRQAINTSSTKIRATLKEDLSLVPWEQPREPATKAIRQVWINYFTVMCIEISHSLFEMPRYQLTSPSFITDYLSDFHFHAIDLTAIDSVNKVVDRIGEAIEEGYELAFKEIKEALEKISATEYKHLTPTDTVTHKINIVEPKPTPFRHKMIKVPFARRQAFYDLVMEQYNAGLLRHSHSPYSSRPLLVTKPDGSLRLTIDYRELNNITVKDSYPLPRIDSLYVQLAQAKYFSKIDCYSGFYQVKLDPLSSPYTAFACEWGLFEYQVMPMGLTNSPATFQRLMNVVLSKEIKEGFVVVYMDDILIFSNSLAEHLEHIRRVISRLKEHRLKIKMSKCEILKQSVQFLGLTITQGQIMPDDARISALYAYERPVTLKQLQAFLGTASYLRRFIQNFAAHAPLRVNQTSRHKHKKHENNFKLE